MYSSNSKGKCLCLLPNWFALNLISCTALETRLVSASEDCGLGTGRALAHGGLCGACTCALGATGHTTGCTMGSCAIQGCALGTGRTLAHCGLGDACTHAPGATGHTFHAINCSATSFAILVVNTF